MGVGEGVGVGVGVLVGVGVSVGVGVAGARKESGVAVKLHAARKRPSMSKKVRGKERFMGIGRIGEDRRIGG